MVRMACFKKTDFPVLRCTLHFMLKSLDMPKHDLNLLDDSVSKSSFEAKIMHQDAKHGLLLQTERFTAMSTSILGRIDELGARIDELEKQIEDMVQQSSTDDQERKGSLLQ
jgi:hypothetical protein